MKQLREQVEKDLRINKESYIRYGSICILTKGAISAYEDVLNKIDTRIELVELIELTQELDKSVEEIEEHLMGVL